MTDGGDFTIYIEGKGKYKRSYLEKHPSHACSLYQYAKQNDIVAYCMCSERGVKMQIAEMKQSRTFVLKRRPKSGPIHHRDCWSRGEKQRAKRVTDYINALTKLNNRNDIKITPPIDIADNAGLPKSGAPTPRSSGPRRAETSLKGLFEMLWVEAKLMQWNPDEKRPNYFSIRNTIQDEVLPKSSCNGHSLESLLYIPKYGKKDEISELVFEHTGATDGTPQRRMIILGLVNEYIDSELGKQMKLFTIDKSAIFYINKPSVIKHLNQALPGKPGSYKYDKKDDTLHWFIATMKPTAQKSGSYLIEEATITPVSREHVPVE